MPNSLFATLGSRSSGGRGCGVAVGMDVGREQNLIRAMVGLGFGFVNFFLGLSIVNFLGLSLVHCDEGVFSVLVCCVGVV